MKELGGNALSPDAKDLVGVGREATRPTAADEARVLEALQIRLAAAPAPPPTSLPPTRPPPPLGGRWKWWAAAGVGAALSAAAYIQLSGSSSDSTVPAAPSAQVQEAPVPSAPPRETPPEESRRQDPGTDSPAATSAASTPPAAQRVAAPKTAPGASIPVQPESHLAEEVALLSKATSALHSGRAQEALATLAEHQRRFPRGALGLQRRAARAQALCQLGRKAEARTELAGLPKASPLAARTRQACGFEE